MKRRICFGLILGFSFISLITIFTTEAQSQSLFTDVPVGYWAYDQISAIYDAKITTGCSQNPLMYCPEDYVTREQMAAFIGRSLGGGPPDNYCDLGMPFSDVLLESWSCKWIRAAYDLGITTGYGDGQYGPTDPVTREQMAVFLTRALSEVPADGYCGTANPFTDVSYDRWSCKNIKRLHELEITTGYGDGRYGPDDYVTRAQMAVFLKRAFLGPGCINISGTWNYNSNGMVTCTSEGESITEYPSGSGKLSINQDGCNISWNDPNYNMLRSGTLDKDNNIEVSGLFAIALDPGVIIDQNFYDANGKVDGNQINLSGSGMVTGTYEGVGGSCTGTDTNLLTRCYDVAVAVLDGGPFSVFPSHPVGSGLPLIIDQAIAIDPERVIAKGFPADSLLDSNAPGQLTRVGQWLDEINKGCVPARVILVGYSLGGNAVRKAPFLNMCSRITIDPIDDTLPFYPYQRNKELKLEVAGGNFKNYLSDIFFCTVESFGLCGYNILGVDPVIWWGSNHWDIAPKVAMSRAIEPEVRFCLGSR